jgi:small-conductance mechanosensitive channel
MSKSPVKREETDAKIVRIENRIIDELAIIGRAYNVDLNKEESIFRQIITEIRQRFNDDICVIFERFFVIKVKEFRDQNINNPEKQSLAISLMNYWLEIFPSKKADNLAGGVPLIFDFEGRFKELRYRNGSCPFCRRLIHVSKDAFKNHLSKNCRNFH